jgi:hypothetical protein
MDPEEEKMPEEMVEEADVEEVETPDGEVNVVEEVDEVVPPEEEM